VLVKCTKMPAVNICCNPSRLQVQVMETWVWGRDAIILARNSCYLLIYAARNTVAANEALLQQPDLWHCQNIWSNSSFSSAVIFFEHIVVTCSTLSCNVASCALKCCKALLWVYGLPGMAAALDTWRHGMGRGDEC
jgi:hypothetical protein